MTETQYKLSCLGQKRRIFQWVSTLLLLLIPWISIQDKGLLRIDLTHLSLHIFGKVLQIQELYLFLLFCLTFGVAFLLITMVLGRVWCGWACPQTTLTDLAEWFSTLVGLDISNNQLHGVLWRKTLAQSFYLLLALLVGANLVWYFIAPQTFFSQIFQGTLHLGAWISWLSITLTVYLDLALIRRLMCKEFCPYGRFQMVLADEGTLTLHLPTEESYRCIECEACAHTCPMGIDIREGLQIECINCGRCLDACRKTMAPGKQSGLIRYSFGTEGRGPKAFLNPRSLLLAFALIIMIMIFSFAINNRQIASLKISVSHMAAAKVLKDGQLATFFNGWVSNRSSAAESYRLEARTKSGQRPLTLKGQTSKIDIASGNNQKIDFVLVTEIPKEEISVEFILINLAGEEVSVADAQVIPTRSR